MTATYTAKDITVLEGLDPVRKRPGMYIGGVDAAGLHHLVWEVLDNAVDEVMNGYASEIGVTLHKDGTSITVTDNGRGIPVDVHPKHKKNAMEIILTTLHAGGKFDAHSSGYKTSGGLHGVGASVVNALSKELIATVKRNGTTWQQTFKCGKPTTKLRKRGAARGTGTTIFFHPDPRIFPKTELSAELICHRLEMVSYIHKGVRVTFEDQVSRSEHVFKHAEGIVDFLRKLVAQQATSSGSNAGKPVHTAPMTLNRDGTAASPVRIDLALQWTESTHEQLHSFVNGIPTRSGGTHENGLRAAVGKAIRNYMDTHKLSPKGISLVADDFREGLVAVLSMFISEPQFQGQTKERLNNPEVQAQIDSAVRPALEHWLNHNPSVAESIVGRVILAARAREASRTAQQQVTRKSATANRLNLPGKLSDCMNPGTKNSELFIVEGDSAGGSAKQGRDRTHQAILPLRGKVLNTQQATLKKVLENKELSDLVTALGCGLGNQFNLSKLRYERVILLADADSDGHHITTLLLTFLYRHMPELISFGKVYIAQPPLYRIDIGKQTYWASDEKDRSRIIDKYGDQRTKPQITRFKGLGEMMPRALWETTLNPKTRRQLRVEIADGPRTDRVMTELMGKDASARLRFITEHASQTDELDL